MANINEFKTALKNGLKLNRYRVRINLPSGVSADTKLLSLMVRAANIPAMETGQIEVLYKGRMGKVSGDRRAAGEWAVTAALNAGQSPAEFKKMADQWEKLASESSDPTEYQADAIIEWLSPDKDEAVIGSWEILNLWLPNSGEISLSDDSTDEIATMELSFAYDEVNPL